MSWKLLGKKTVLDTFRGSIQSWQVSLPNGKKKSFFINAEYSFVVVFAVDTKGKAILLKQHYVGQQKKLFSLVAGIIDENEKPVKTAERELLEEAGYTAKKFIALGESIKGKYATGTVYHFLALGAAKVQKPELEEAEDIKISMVPIAEIKKLLDQGKLPDAFAEICARRALERII